MTPYELMIRANRYLICGSKPALTYAQKTYITARLLSARSSAEDCTRFYRGVRYPENRDSAGRRMYPELFIPPYQDGKKYRSILGQLPHTHIFSANLYELEILRLLFLFSGADDEIRSMVSHTLKRLKTTCFGNCDDGVGECFDTSLVVLRFLAAVAPDQTVWIQSRIENYQNHVNDAKRAGQTPWYYFLCISELPPSYAHTILRSDKQHLLSLKTQLEKPSAVILDEFYHPIKSAILHRCISMI